jgi:hypothetical protein
MGFRKPILARIYSCSHVKYNWILRMCDGVVKYFVDKDLAEQWCIDNDIVLMTNTIRANRSHYVTGKSGYIYIISGAESVKVGYTTNEPADRLKACQTGSPVDLKLVYCELFKDVVAVERVLHDRLFELGFWDQGEWFKCDADEVVELLNMFKNEGFT